MAGEGAQPQDDWLTWSGWGFWSFVVAVIALLVAVLALVLPLAQNRRKNLIEELKEDDPELRREIADTLRSASVGRFYYDNLVRGLALLDRCFGPPGSSAALGVCVIVALVYGWGAFYLGWGLFGASGTVGGVALLEDAPQPSRAVAGLALVAIPAMAYALAGFLARRAHRLERRLKLGLRRRWRIRRRRRFEILWRSLSALLLMTLFVGSALTRDELFFVFWVLMFFSWWPLLGALAGSLIAGRLRPGLPAEAGAFVVGAVAGAGAVAVAVAVAVALALAGAGALALAGALAGAVAGAGAGAGAGAVATARALIRSDAHRRGIWSGALGGLVGIGLLSGVVEGGSLRDELVLLLLVFFLILPLANAVWDWLSWWATRALGARLVRVLEPAQSGGERAVAVLGHGLGDLAIALGLLLAMAFSLAFGFEAYDQVALRQTGVPAFNLRETVAAAAADPWGEGFWLTTMLLSTLFPTLLHALVLLGAPLGLVLIPTGVRLELAALLDGYDDAPDRQAMIRRKVATWWVYGRFAAWTLAGLLLTVVLLRWPTVVYLGLLNPAEMARWAAEGGIGAAEWLGRVLLGNAAMQ